MASSSCFFCGAPNASDSACPHCGMRPRVLPSQRQAYRQMAGWILGTEPGRQGGRQGRRHGANP